MKEKVFFVNDPHRIAVTSKRLVLGRKTYPLSHITFVETLEYEGNARQQSDSAPALRLISYGLLGLLALSMVQGLVAIAILLSISLFLVWIFRHGEAPTQQKTVSRYHLIIGLPSGRTSVYACEDQQFVEDIARALSHALID